MTTLRHSASFNSAVLAVALFGSATLAMVKDAAAQGYATTFNVGTGTPAYSNGNTLSDTDGWVTNDEDIGQTYNGVSIGQSDDTQNVNGYTSGTSDLAALLGGAFNTGTNGALPGHSTVTLSHNANLGLTGPALFNTDFVVTAPGTTHTGHDSFGFIFAGGGTSLFSVNFVPTSTSSATVDNISITSSAGTTAIGSFSLGFRYKLTVGINLTAHTFNVSLTPETNTGAINGSTVLLTATNVGYTGTLTDIGAFWTLATPTTSASGNGGMAGGTAYTSGGDNVLLFDNLSIVPEPSTYAMVGIGLAIAGIAIKRRSLLA